MKLKIIGLGSPHGDDRVGWEVIRKLQRTAYQGAELIELDRPGPGLINYLDDCDRAILIDACDAGWQPGEWQKLSLNELLETAELQGGNSHQLGLADSLLLANVTGTELPSLECYVIQMQQAGLMQPLSPVVKSAVSTIAEAINKDSL